MKLGMVVRNMGPQATAATLVACARAAEAAGLDDVWVVDHVAIPPDDAEGSDGRHLDPLATLAFLAGATARIGLGTSVLILPYRPPLPTAKAIATIQELSGGRLRLGVGVGWMGADPAALRAPIAALRERFTQAGRPPPQVVAMGRLPLEDAPRARAQLAELSQNGVTGIVHGGERYADAGGFARTAERLAGLAG